MENICIIHPPPPPRSITNDEWIINNRNTYNKQINFLLPYRIKAPINRRENIDSS